MIQVKGLALERFVNRALHGNLEIWGVKRVSANAITLYASIASFYELRKLTREQRLKVRILKKHGLPVSLLGLRYRKVILFGWIVVLALILLASRSVWFISVNGCDVIDESEIMAILDNMDVRIGARRSGIQTSQLGIALMNEDSRISWAGATLTGVVLTIDVKEAVLAPDIVDDTVPAHIYAAKDGIVKKIVALNGKANVKAGDAVMKGELLISGYVGSNTGTGFLVRARGDVIAQVIYAFSATAGPQVLQSARTGEFADFVRIGAFGLAFDSLEAPFEQHDEEYMSTTLLKNCFVPLKIEAYRYYELKDAYVELDTEQLKTIALLNADQAMRDSLPKDAKMLSKESKTEILDSGAVKATIVVTTEENIAQTRELR